MALYCSASSNIDDAVRASILGNNLRKCRCVCFEEIPLMKSKCHLNIIVPESSYNFYKWCLLYDFLFLQDKHNFCNRLIQTNLLVLFFCKILFKHILEYSGSLIISSYHISWSYKVDTPLVSGWGAADSLHTRLHLWSVAEVENRGTRTESPPTSRNPRTDRNRTWTCVPGTVLQSGNGAKSDENIDQRCNPWPQGCVLFYILESISSPKIETKLFLFQGFVKEVLSAPEPEE